MLGTNGATLFIDKLSIANEDNAPKVPAVTTEVYDGTEPVISAKATVDTVELTSDGADITVGAVAFTLKPAKALKSASLDAKAVPAEGNTYAVVLIVGAKETSEVLGPV